MTHLTAAGLPRRIATLALTVGLVAGAAGCGAKADVEDDASASPVIQPADEPDAAGEDLTDIEPAGEDATDQDVIDQGDAEDRAEQLMGREVVEAEAAAQTNGWPYRVGRIGDEPQMMTEDWVPGRVTVGIDSVGGVEIVTEVTVEYDGGPRTFKSDYQLD
jgi:hypothetical protein